MRRNEDFSKGDNMSKIPEFKTLEEEVNFWESNSSADYWNEFEEVEIEIDLFTNKLNPRPFILAKKPDTLKNPWGDLESILTQYFTNISNNLLVIQDVPAYRSLSTGREYILEAVADKMESLLAVERNKDLEPLEFIQVPVFSYNMAVA